MNFIELQMLLQNLTNSKVSLSKIAEILNVTPANISKRAKNNSELTVSELAVVEKFYNKCVYKSPINSLERQFDEKLLEKQSNIGERLNQIQEKNNLSDEQMAVLLNISIDEYLNIKNSKTTLDTKILNNLKQNFKISIDWLLYGE